MPRMHAISLLASGALIGTIVGYAIARYGPLLSPVSSGDGGSAAAGSETPKAKPAWINTMRPLFWRHAKADSSPDGTSGNHAFEAYREATMRRLHDEQQEFAAYLDRLRKAQDKETFDAFLANRSRKHQE